MEIKVLQTNPNDTTTFSFDRRIAEISSLSQVWKEGTLGGTNV